MTRMIMIFTDLIFHRFKYLLRFVHCDLCEISVAFVPACRQAGLNMIFMKTMIINRVIKLIIF
jgi:hypothetical protein